MRTATPPAALPVEMIRQFSVYEIGVRSKQDGLAKCIVCGQALWNLVQCLSRVGLKLPVSPLELHTALYIVNLVVMYSVWWSKPVDLGHPILLCLMQDYNAGIEEPVQSTDENSRWVYGPPIPPPAHLVAFVVKYGEEPTEKASLDASKVVPDLVSALKTVQQAKEFVEQISETETQIPKEVHKEHHDALVTARRNLQDLRGFSEVGPNYASVFRKLDLNSEMDIIERETYNAISQNEDEVFYERIDEANESTDELTDDRERSEYTFRFHPYRIQYLERAEDFIFRCLIKTDPDHIVEYEQQRSDNSWWQGFRNDISARLNLLHNAASNSLVLNQFIRLPNIFTCEKTETGCPDTVRVQALFPDSWKTKHRIILLLFGSLTSIIYGGVHYIKWNDSFPTPIERSLWRVSCCIATSGVLPIVLLSITGFSRQWLNEEKVWKSWWKWKRWFDGICKTLRVITAVFFVTARTFLVVEAFVSIRILTAGAYQTVKWMDYFAKTTTIGPQ